MHEICHALGLIHAQQHPDQAKVIEVMRDNIAEWAQHLFDPVIEGNPAVILNMPYDIASVVHYRPSVSAEFLKAEVILNTSCDIASVLHYRTSVNIAISIVVFFLFGLI